MNSIVWCDASSYCMHYGVVCLGCIHNSNLRFPHPVNYFTSSKCGSQAMMCARRRDYDACYDCDPYDPPCSLYKCCVTFGGGEKNG